MVGFFETAGMFLAMAVIIGAAWGASRFLGKRFGVPSSGKSIQIIEQVSLGADRSLLLVRCGSHTYLLGSSQAGIQMIDEIEEGDTMREEERSHE